MAEPRYVFQCSRRHRVAVDPGRYWAPARCPVCKSPVDRLRAARLGQWVRGAAPHSRLRIGKVVLTPFDGIGWLLVLFMLLVALAYRVLGDRTWWGTALIYSGRWPWLLPVAVLALSALAWHRQALVPIALAALVVMGPVMGGRLSTAPLWHAKAPLRILTFNVEGGPVVSLRLKELLEATKPDIAGFEECGLPMQAALLELQGWAAVDTGSTCFLSRYPLRRPPDRMAAADFRAAGGAAVVARYEVSDPVNAPRLIDANNILRDTESRVVRRWIDSTTPPRIVLGDFNLPVESVIWRRYWDDLSDAFDAAGNGWGFTKLNGWIEVRIDHVLVDDQLKVVGAHVGDDWGSDHLPFIAEIVRR
jgi:vancomycin resistance protein VanJ